jgi:putative SOS response-associated peptidase YedK
MCYDIKATLEAQLSRAKRRNDLQAITEIEERLVPYTDLPLYHSSGFAHPALLIYTNSSPTFPEVATWGLIPSWVKDDAQRKKQWNHTLNARAETLFEKPSFRDAARNQRCLLYVDGFYEHHHCNKNAYPFFIYRKDQQPLAFAAIWTEWRSSSNGGLWRSFSIVTTEGNATMAKIHNNPKLGGPRMPVILPAEVEDVWLRPVEDEVDVQVLQQLLVPYPEEFLEYHPVKRLRGSEYPGNVPEISLPVKYDDLSIENL